MCTLAYLCCISHRFNELGTVEGQGTYHHRNDDAAMFTASLPHYQFGISGLCGHVLGVVGHVMLYAVQTWCLPG